MIGIRGIAAWALASVLGLAALTALVGVAAAERTTVRSDAVEMAFGADFSPRKLPGARRDVVAFSIGGTIASADHSNAPTLRKLVLGLGRNSSIDATGLPGCEDLFLSVPRSLGEIEAACEGAIVGRGRVGFGIVFPETRHFSAASRLVVVNGSADTGGTTLNAYAQITHPIVASIVLPIGIRGGPGDRAGTQMILTVPRIAGGLGFVSDFRVRLLRRLADRSDGVASLACPDKRLSVKVRAMFSEGAAIRTELPLACQRKDKVG